MRLWLLFLSIFSLLPVSNAVAGEIRLAVASNFLSPAKRLAEEFQQQTGHSIKISSASTGKLYAQIINGAPFDIFLAANVSEPRRLEKENRIVAGSRFTYARGRIALLGADASKIVDKEALHKANRLSLANPKLAPYGVAAMTLMQALNVPMNKLRLIYAENVAQAFLYVRSANVQYGFVALSQIIEHYGKEVPGNVWVPESHLYAPIEQQAVLLTRGGRNKAAIAFVDFLKKPATQSAILTYGYSE